MDIEKNIVRQYDINGLLQALRDELQPITDRAQSHQLTIEEAPIIATEIVQSSPAIEGLLAVLTELTEQQLSDLLKKDGDKK